LSDYFYSYWSSYFAVTFYFSRSKSSLVKLLLGCKKFHCNFTSVSTEQCTVISILHYLIVTTFNSLNTLRHSFGKVFKIAEERVWCAGWLLKFTLVSLGSSTTFYLSRFNFYFYATTILRLLLLKYILKLLFTALRWSWKDRYSACKTWGTIPHFLAELCTGCLVPHVDKRVGDRWNCVIPRYTCQPQCFSDDYRTHTKQHYTNVLFTLLTLLMCINYSIL